MIRFDNVGALPNVSCTFAYWFESDNPSMPETGPPNVPAVLVKFTVPYAEPCVTDAKLTVFEAPVPVLAHVLTVTTFAPAPNVTAPAVALSPPAPPKNCNVPPVRFTGTVPARAATIANPPLSIVN
jgi:hypothetical protein